MATLSSLSRKHLAKSSFGLPGERKYPMPDKSHAANAKARASQQVGKSISEGQKAEIDAKANRVLGESMKKSGTSKMPAVKGASSHKQAAGKGKTQGGNMKVAKGSKSDPWDK